jgi:hypothetical protein
MLRAGVAAALRKDLGQKADEKYPHQDGHIRYQHGRVRHFISLKAGNREQGLGNSLFRGQWAALPTLKLLSQATIAHLPMR